MLIRDERLSDEAAIQVLIADAFRDMPFSDQTEVFIMPALRRAGALTISLIAEEDGEIVGQAAFSPVTIDGKAGHWYGLGPIAVAPGRQRQGIGGALIVEGLARLRAMNAGGCLLVGHPDYYPRFGFRHEPRLSVPGVPPEAFMILPFGDAVPAGVVAFHPAFAATA